MHKYEHSLNCRCGSTESLEKGSDWYIAYPRYHNCFWVYLRHNDRIHTLSEVARLLELSISAITSIEKRAFSKLRHKVKVLNLEEKE